MKSELPNLFTQEMIVFLAGVEKADLSSPVTVVVDKAGNHLLQDGNHRAKKSEITGEALEREIIGTSPIDATDNPNYRLISELILIE